MNSQHVDGKLFFRPTVSWIDATGLLPNRDPQDIVWTETTQTTETEFETK
jgi:hypothetical protein